MATCCRSVARVEDIKDRSTCITDPVTLMADIHSLNMPDCAMILQMVHARQDPAWADDQLDRADVPDARA